MSISVKSGDLSADVSWDSSGLSSGSSITVYIDVSSTGGWRLKKGSTTYFDTYGNLTSNFTGSVGVTYQFQLWDTVEQTWQLKNFTVTQDSSGGGGDSGGGDSGGGDSGNRYHVYYYNYDSTSLGYMTVTEGSYFMASNGNSVNKPDDSSSSDYTITGDANGGTFPDGSKTASITAKKIITISYQFSN